MRELNIWLHLAGRNMLVGTIKFVFERQLSSVVTFDPAFLTTKEAKLFEAYVPLTCQVVHRVGLFPFLQDVCPDRWGKTLIKNRYAATRRIDTGPAHTLDESEYLLAVQDVTRPGVLRFSYTDSPDLFIAESKTIHDPAYLNDLLQASNRYLESGDRASLQLLLDAGSSSLGGARPKSNIRIDDDLYLAKFSHPHDEAPIMSLEATTLELAGKLGLSVPKAHLFHLGAGDALALKRFDRDKDKRIPYMSAMTLLGAKDGESSDYTFVVDSFYSKSADPARDFEELWRRLVFYVAIHNTDDHLRNLGFLYQNGSWRLSPMFDVNPAASPVLTRQTAIFGHRGLDAVEGLKELADYIGLAEDVQRECVRDTLCAISSFAPTAKRNGIYASQVKAYIETQEVCCKALRRY